MSSEILQFALQFSVYSGYITFSLGAIGNILNIIVFTQLKLFRNNQCAFYLVIESLSSLFYQFIAITVTILTTIYGDDATGRSSIWCETRYTCTQAFALISYFTICFAAIDQYFSTNYRFSCRQMCTMKLARCFSLGIICLAIAHSIALGSSFNIQSTFGCIISNSIWLQYATYFFYPILSSLVPIIIASFFGIFAYQNVRRIIRRQIPIVRRRLDRQMTAMVIIRIVIFVSLVSPYTIYRIYAINFSPPKTKPLEYAIGRLIQTLFLFLVSLHFTVSFYVFFISSSRFRRQVKLVLVKNCWLRLKSIWYSRHNQVNPRGTDTDNVPVEFDGSS